MPLVRAHHETVDFVALEPLAAKLARAIQSVLDGRSNSMIKVTAGSANAARFAEWRIAQNPFGALLRFGSDGKDDLLIHLPGYLLSQIVDVHYGGRGTVQMQTEFTAGELQFAERIGGRFALILETAGLGSMRFQEAQPDLLQAAWPKSRDAIAIQPFTCDGGAIKPAIVSLILSANAASELSRHGESNFDDNRPTDQAWADRMRAAAMRVRLPARTILARSDISFQRLLTLAPGDILPLLLPMQVPLTVAGHIFAHGSLGEANGRAALLIEKMEKEMDQ